MPDEGQLPGCCIHNVVYGCQQCYEDQEPVGESENPTYKTIFLGQGAINKDGEPGPDTVVLGPVVDDLSKFHPIGWYAVIKNPDRRWWQFWKPKMKGIYGLLKDEPKS